MRSRLASVTRTIVLVVGLAGTCVARAVPITTGFEGLGNELVTTQIPGLTFTNTAVLIAGFTLNEINFPPHGGVNVATDVAGPTGIGIEFESPVESFSAYFTYLSKLTLSAYDGLTLLGSVTSLFSANYVGVGTPNELIQLTGLGAFTRVTITGSPQGGGNFVMDDLTAVPAAVVTPVPEPNAALLALTGILLLSLARRPSPARRRH